MVEFGNSNREDENNASSSQEKLTQPEKPKLRKLERDFGTTGQSPEEAAITMEQFRSIPGMVDAITSGEYFEALKLLGEYSGPNKTPVPKSEHQTHARAGIELLETFDAVMEGVLKQKYPDVAELMEKNDFLSAREKLKNHFTPQYANKRIEAEVNNMTNLYVMEDALDRGIGFQCRKLTETGDNTQIKQVIDQNGIDGIGMSNFGFLPKELVVESPTIQRHTATHIAKKFKSYPASGKRLAEEYVERGLMTQEAADALIASEPYQKQLAQNIAKEFKSYPASGKRLAEEYVERGLMTQEAADALIASEPYQKQLAQNIAKKFKSYPASGKRLAEEYVERGLMTQEAADALIASEPYQKQLAQNIAKEFKSYPASGKRLAEEYVERGLMTQEAADALIASEPYQKQLAQNIAKEFKSYPASGKCLAEEYVERGLMTQEAASQLIQQLEFNG